MNVTKKVEGLNCLVITKKKFIKNDLNNLEMFLHGTNFMTQIIFQYLI
jgi:hypothetical protein